MAYRTRTQYLLIRCFFHTKQAAVNRCVASVDLNCQGLPRVASYAFRVYMFLKFHVSRDVDTTPTRCGRRLLFNPVQHHPLFQSSSRIHSLCFYSNIPLPVPDFSDCFAVSIHNSSSRRGRCRGSHSPTAMVMVPTCIDRRGR